jgi:hypothetical protein
MSTANDQVQRVRAAFGEDWGRFAERWVRYALKTSPVDGAGIAAAINEAYRLAGFGAPRVVVVPSPGVVAFAGTFASRVWAIRSTNPAFDPIRSISSLPRAPAEHQAVTAATFTAVEAATKRRSGEDDYQKCSGDVGNAVLQATYGPADLATVNALSQEVWLEARSVVEEIEALTYWDECIRTAMRDMFGNPRLTDLVASAAQQWAQPLANALFSESRDAQGVIAEAADWWTHCQAGNMALYDTACIAAARDVLKLNLPEHQDFSVWERCQLQGGYRYSHPNFCLVSDFPQVLDEQSMVHPTQVRRKSLEQRALAPVARWSDGWIV